MSLFEKNMESIRLHKAELWFCIEQNKVEKSGISVWSSEAKDGNLVLYIEKDNKVYRMNSAYRPIMEAEKWASAYHIQHLNTVCQIFGLVNGYFLRELLKKGLNDTKYIIYEPCEEVLFHVLQQYDMTDIITNDNIIITTNEEMLQSALAKWVDVGNVELNLICEYPQYERIFEQERIVFLKSIRDSSTLAITIQNTTKVSGKNSVVNVLASLQRLRSGHWITDLQVLAERGVPAYIVAAGPSLDKNIQELKNAKGHGVIFAVDKAITSLRKAGIEPDFTIVEDARKNPVHFKDEKVKSIPLIANISANKKIVDCQKGDIYYYSCMEYSDELVERLGNPEVVLNSGGSVATIAFSVCVTVGFKTVVFVGQDLAYGEGGTTHTGSIVSGEEVQGSIRYQVEGVNGNVVKTRNDWYIFLKWYESAILEYPNIMFLDATEGGAKIQGTSVTTLKEVVEKYKNKVIDCKMLMKECKQPMSIEVLKKLSDFLKQDVKDLNWIEKEMIRAEKNMDKLIRACENKSILTTSYAGTLKEISDISKKIEKMSIVKLLNHYVAKETQEATVGLNYMTEDELENRKRVYKISKKVYQIEKQGAIELKVELEKLQLL